MVNISMLQRATQSFRFGPNTGRDTTIQGRSQRFPFVRCRRSSSSGSRSAPRSKENVKKKNKKRSEKHLRAAKNIVDRDDTKDGFTLPAVISYRVEQKGKSKKTKQRRNEKNENLKEYITNLDPTFYFTTKIDMNQQSPQYTIRTPHNQFLIIISQDDDNIISVMTSVYTVSCTSDMDIQSASMVMRKALELNHGFVGNEKGYYLSIDPVSSVASSASDRYNVFTSCALSLRCSIPLKGVGGKDNFGDFMITFLDAVLNVQDQLVDASKVMLAPKKEPLRRKSTTPNVARNTNDVFYLSEFTSPEEVQVYKLYKKKRKKQQTLYLERKKREHFAAKAIAGDRLELEDSTENVRMSTKTFLPPPPPPPLPPPRRIISMSTGTPGVLLFPKLSVAESNKIRLDTNSSSAGCLRKSNNGKLSTFASKTPVMSNKQLNAAGRTTNYSVDKVVISKKMKKSAPKLDEKFRSLKGSMKTMVSDVVDVDDDGRHGLFSSPLPPIQRISIRKQNSFPYIETIEYNNNEMFTGRRNHDMRRRSSWL